MHPIDSLYTVKSVKGTVPVIERIFRWKMRDSGKYFACFCVISFVSVAWFSVDHFGTCLPYAPTNTFCGLVIIG